MMESQKAALWALLLLAIIQLLSHFVNAALFQPHATALRVDGNGDAFDAAADSRNGDELHFLNEQKIQNLTARQSRLASRGDEKRAAIPARMQGPRGRKPPARQRHTTAAPAIEETMAVTKEMLFDYSQIRVHACGRELMEEMLQSCYVFKIAIQQLNIHDLYLILGLERVEGTQSEPENQIDGEGRSAVANDLQNVLPSSEKWNLRARVNKKLSELCCHSACFRYEIFWFCVKDMQGSGSHKR